jgi:hypothetical protein
MNADRSYLILTALMFAFMGVVQLTRAVQGWPVTINTFAVPVPASYGIGVVMLGLSGWAIAQLRRG